ncbi:MAG: Smr/MutS family protein, partial [Gemmatimonadales bacterium]|nr:Smr/MutS family protein [Gemmatimonadales bacterium]
ARPGGAVAPAARAAADLPTAEPTFELDLRGFTADDAEGAVLAAIDGAVLAEQPYLRIIHGKGTGVVRQRVREVVARDRRVRRFDFAPATQGGIGVTVVEFA